MTRAIHLHGRLKKDFGPLFNFDVATAAEALRALNCAFPGKFVAALREGNYRVIRGRRRGGLDLTLDLVTQFKLGNADLHIVPVATGSKNSTGAIKAIAGVALIGAAIFFSGGTLAAPLAGMGGAVIPGIGAGVFSWGTVALLGLGLTLAGVSQMISPSKADENKETNSFSLTGAVNVNEQGNPVPLIYGEVITGSQAVSGGIDIEDIGKYKPIAGGWGGSGTDSGGG